MEKDIIIIIMSFRMTTSKKFFSLKDYSFFNSKFRAAELGGLVDFNISSWLIDIWAKFGWAYDLKKVSNAMIERRMKRTGDGTCWLSHEESHKEGVWGYGDESMN